MQKPKHLLILKIIGVIGILLAIVGVVLSVIGFGDFESNNFMIGGICTCFGFFIGASGLMFGFMPNFAKMHAQTARYIQEENKDTFKGIADLSADITKDAVSATARAVKDGLEDCVFCKSCGKAIDADSKYCRHCGKEQ